MDDSIKTVCDKIEEEHKQLAVSFPDLFVTQSVLLKAIVSHMVTRICDKHTVPSEDVIFQAPNKDVVIEQLATIKSVITTIFNQHEYTDIVVDVAYEAHKSLITATVDILRSKDSFCERTIKYSESLERVNPKYLEYMKNKILDNVASQASAHKDEETQYTIVMSELSTALFSMFLAKLPKPNLSNVEAMGRRIDLGTNMLCNLFNMQAIGLQSAILIRDGEYQYTAKTVIVCKAACYNGTCPSVSLGSIDAHDN